MTFSILDIAMVFLVVVVCVKVTLNGFVAEFFSKAAVVAGGMAAVLFFRKLSPVFAGVLGNNGYPEIVAFLVLFLAAYLLVKIIQHIAGSAFENESMANLDKSLGFFLGLAEGALLAAFILTAMQIQPWFDLSSVTRDSLFIRLLEPLVRDRTFRIMELSSLCLKI